MVQDAAPLPGYMEPYGLLCSILQDATNDWRWELGEHKGADLGAGVTTWRARPDGPNIGAIVLHMISAELYWFEQCALGREISAEERKLLMCDEMDVNGGQWPDPPAEPLSWYFDLHDRFRARTLEAVKTWDPPETLKPGGGGQCSLRWIFGHLIQHETYHGGQIVMLNELWKHRHEG